MNWILENKEWIFSGIGVVAVTTVLGLFVKKKFDGKVSNQTITSGDKSTNVQGRDNVSVTIGERHEK